MSKIQFTENAWNDYVSYQKEDKKILDKINKILKDISRNEKHGIGHAEALKHDLSGLYSRRIDKKNRLVYRILEDNVIEIVSCKFHYQDK